jgi:hypothetical protein
LDEWGFVYQNQNFKISRIDMVLFGQFLNSENPDSDNYIIELSNLKYNCGQSKFSGRLEI